MNTTTTAIFTALLLIASCQASEFKTFTDYASHEFDSSNLSFKDILEQCIFKEAPVCKGRIFEVFEDMDFQNYLYLQKAFRTFRGRSHKMEASKKSTLTQLVTIFADCKDKASLDRQMITTADGRTMTLRQFATDPKIMLDGMAAMAQVGFHQNDDFADEVLGDFLTFLQPLMSFEEFNSLKAKEEMAFEKEMLEKNKKSLEQIDEIVEYKTLLISHRQHHLEAGHWQTLVKGTQEVFEEAWKSNAPLKSTTVEADWKGDHQRSHLQAVLLQVGLRIAEEGKIYRDLFKKGFEAAINPKHSLNEQSLNEYCNSDALCVWGFISNLTVNGFTEYYQQFASYLTNFAAHSTQEDPIRKSIIERTGRVVQFLDAFLSKQIDDFFAELTEGD